MLSKKGRDSMGHDGSLKFDTEINEKGFSASIKKIGSIAKGGLAVIGGSVAGVATAFGVMTKNALDSYASLEQNIGGIETLFKDSSQKVIDSAKNAYKTAGLSANAYMETVTSFSASLLQSLENDTEKAADYADRAITDMSDNANKMGTSMEMIQNAYQGFAKQNYTMLDNLKLGYGGTKEEMARLVSDALKLTDVQNELGITVDENSLSFANIVNAISVMQKHMGIAGTTAKEASETISGSIATAKGAFDNFLNGTGSPEALAESFVTAGKNVLKGLGEIVPRLLQTLPEVKKLIQENLADSLSGDNVQKMVESGKNVVMSLINGMLESIPTIIPVALNLIQFIANAITTNVPILLQKGYELLSSLVDGFVKAIPKALPKILDFTQGIGDKLAEAAPVMIQKGFELLQKLAEGIVAAVPILIARVPEIISTFANIINDNFPTILMKGVQLLGQLVMGLIQAIPTLIANIPQIISAIVDTLMAFQWLSLGKNIIQFLGNGIKSMIGFVKTAGTNILNGIKGSIQNLPSALANIGRTAMTGLGNAISSAIGFVKSAASKIVNAIVSAIAAIPGKMLSIGSNIVQGLWNGISDMTGWIIDKIGGFASSVVSSIKDFFGIHSPSKLMRDEVGKYLAQGIGIGFEKNIPVKQMTKSMKKAVGDMQATALQVTSTTPMTTNVATKAVTNNYTDMQMDYKKIKKAQLEAMNESNERPVVLNNRQINRVFRDGGYQPA